MNDNNKKTTYFSVPLWSSAPEALGSAPEDSPQLTVHLANKPNGCGVIVCPGGGYRALASDHEGLQIAQWLNARGIHAFVLRYRLGPRYHSSVSRLDGQRAVRMVRHHAKAWGVDSARLGMLGFSAGGHLILATALLSNEPLADWVRDDIDQHSSRPNFLVPIYAVTNGERRGRKANEYNAMDVLVNSATPPSFIVHHHQDSVVPAHQATLFYDALLKAKVSAELHVFNYGDHGLGLDRSADGADLVSSPWGDLMLHWLRRQGFCLDPVRSGQRCAVNGEVLLDDAPVGLGWLTWVPKDPDWPIARTRLTGAGRGRFHVEPAEGPVPGPYRLILHVVSAVYPADSTGAFSMDQALVFEQAVDVVANRPLQWRLKTSDGIRI